MLPLSIVNAWQMLNVTAVTLDDRLQLDFLAIPDAVPKVLKLARYTQEAFDGLADSLLAPVVAKSQRKLAAHDRILASTKRATALRIAPSRARMRAR